MLAAGRAPRYRQNATKDANGRWRHDERAADRLFYNRGVSAIHREQLGNGVWLLGEAMPEVESLAMTVLTPAGLASQPADQQGVAALLVEMLFRGAGGRNAREHSDALDRLGVQRDASAETAHLRLSATMLAEHAHDALPLLLDMVRRPALDEASLAPAKSLCLQVIDAVQDDPSQRAMLELRRRHFPDPFGRPPQGVREHLESLRIEDVRAFHRRRCVAAGTIVAFAGKLDWPRLRDGAAELLADWAGAADEPQRHSQPQRDCMHLHDESSQTHIGLAWDALPEPHDDSLLHRATVSVLSGGMSSRLIDRVREKRGLCYSVYAGYVGRKDVGAMIAYAGTTPPRAQQTLDVLRGELSELACGVERDEFDRAMVGMKSGLVMHGESSSARAGAIASDQYLRGRPRSLEDVARQIDAISLDRLNGFLHEHPVGDLTMVTLGPDVHIAPGMPGAK